MMQIINNVKNNNFSFFLQVKSLTKKVRFFHLYFIFMFLPHPRYGEIPQSGIKPMSQQWQCRILNQEATREFLTMSIFKSTILNLTLKKIGVVFPLVAQWKGMYWFDPWPCSVGLGFGIAMSCDVDHRGGSDLALLWLWCRPATAGPIWPLA